MVSGSRRPTAPSSPAAGFRSDTTHDTKRRKNETEGNWSLDQAVGCNELLGGGEFEAFKLLLSSDENPLGRLRQKYLEPD